MKHWRALLLPFNPLYKVVMLIRKVAYDTGMLSSVHLGPRTISVGNIEVGGTGKSPFVSGLVRTILMHGGRPVVLARGYRSGLPSYASALLLDGVVKAVKDAESASQLALRHLNADEARMISVHHPSVPVIIGRRRTAAYRSFLDELAGYSPTHLILDDGFQHWQVARDIDVVLISEDLSEDFLLPAGDLREPVSALNRAGVIVRVTGRMPGSKVIDQAVCIPGRATDAKVRYGSLKRLVDGRSPELKKPQSPVAVCGIARPDAFLEGIRQAGVFPLRVLNRRDHQPFTEGDFSESFLVGADSIVTTEKDFWRDPEIMKSTGLPVWILPMEIDFSYEILL